ncbi:hypothetical protein B0A49_05770 [Cryomyces minteri]|uniref:Uncharacterized protein n=1 Tax=Cryomyces minteri TaxID=331657 RepID=A0A4V5NG26_9PEZI|nr:hypothetical protein B0A49_05770 [Cryomyces minteri]
MSYPAPPWINRPGMHRDASLWAPTASLSDPTRSSPRNSTTVPMDAGAEPSVTPSSAYRPLRARSPRTIVSLTPRRSDVCAARGADALAELDGLDEESACDGGTRDKYRGSTSTRSFC